jgi:uncharacterized protein (DUF2461 family)
MAFRGWPDQALEFFEGLELDNSKAYWAAHKTVYDEKVRAPMEELVAELEPHSVPARSSGRTGMCGSAPTSLRTRLRSLR